MRRFRIRTVFLIVIVASLAGAARAAEPVEVSVERRGSSARVETRTIDGVTYFDLAGLAEVAGGSRHWNPTTRKMVLLVGSRRVSVAIGSPFAAIDRDIVNLRRPVVMRGGEVWVPQDFLTGPFADLLFSSVDWAPGDREATAVPVGPDVTSVSLEDRSRGTAVVLELTGPATFDAASAARGHVDLLLHDASMPDSLSVETGLGTVERVELVEGVRGVSVSVSTVSSAASYTIDLRDSPHRVELVVRAPVAERAVDSPIPVPALRPPSMPGDARDREDDGLRTVMIDPGHGGTDAGSIGPTGLLEKDVTLGVARELSRELQRNGFYVFMTRSADSFVPVARRSEIANVAGADVFVSLQCGAWHSAAAAGFQVHYQAGSTKRPSPSTNGLVRETPAAAPATAGHIWDQAHREQTGASRALARRIHGALAATAGSPDRGVVGGEVNTLKGCSMPAAMVELGYITNHAEEDLLGDPSYQQSLARAIARGIAAFVLEREEAGE